MERIFMQALNSADVAVIGAGPVGCVTALTYAQQGAQVVLLEAHPHTKRRLAGEWLHPQAVKILQQLGVDLSSNAINYRTGQGFVVFPGDNTDPIQLPYPDGEEGLGCEHNTLLAVLWNIVKAHNHIQLLEHARVTSITDQTLTVEQHLLGEVRTLSANLIVGADGQASTARKSLGICNHSYSISYMAGLQLTGVEMPFEGFGHVMLGGMGPALMYRIGVDVVRLCLDVPHNFPREAGALWAGYHSVLPESLRPAFSQATCSQEIAWVVNRSCSRIHYGRPGLALVGDATGYFHPITATGMTVGFLDSQCLAQSHRFESYQRDRTFNTYIPEVLATTLYRVFTQQEIGATALRNAIYRMWREDTGECCRTMQLLSGAETSWLAFSRSFLKGVSLAMGAVIWQHLHQRQWQQLLRGLASLGQWVALPLMLALQRSLQSWKLHWQGEQSVRNVLKITRQSIIGKALVLTSGGRLKWFKS
jgi:squalene monooxygenase